jgi:hypothetical protein
VNERYEAQVAAVLEAISVRPGAYLWFGRRVEVAAGDSLATAVQRRLLGDFYALGAPRPMARATAAPARADAAAFAGALSQANCGRGAWQTGWAVEATEEDAIAVVRPGDGLVLRASPQDCRLEGALADVRMPKDVAGRSRGTLLVLGDAPPAPGDDRVRLCWNVTAVGAVLLVKRLTYALNQAGLPFTLELRDDPAAYADGAAADLLLARRDVAALLALLRPLLRSLGAQLREGAPAFTKPLRHGIALAEEPAGGERFAEHRCRLLAEAIAGSGQRPAATVETVRERFAADGIALDRPYLQPGSRDAYDAA